MSRSMSSTGYPIVFLALFLAAAYDTCSSLLLRQLLTAMLKQRYRGREGIDLKSKNLGSEPNLYTNFMTWRKLLRLPSLSFLARKMRIPPSSLGCVGMKWIGLPQDP